MKKLFNSHLELAHLYWKLLLRPGDSVVDATCGNGKDTLILSKNVLTEDAGSVIGMDIQQPAIENTTLLLKKNLSDLQWKRVHLFHESHTNFPPIAWKKPVKLVVYNLGYLPGGDKTLTTKTENTLQSVQRAMQLIATDGAVSITCYPGHEEGKVEEQALLHMAAGLDSSQWNVTGHRWLNRPFSPTVLLIQKR